MQGRKIEQARAAGRQLLGTLRPDDRFRLIDFSSDVRTFRDDFVLGDRREHSRGHALSRRARGAGRHEHRGRAARSDARRRSPRDDLPLILFMTDGEPTVGERSPTASRRSPADAERTRRRRAPDLHLRAGVGRQCEPARAARPGGPRHVAVRSARRIGRAHGRHRRQPSGRSGAHRRARSRRGRRRVSRRCCRRSRATCSPIATSWCSRATRVTDRRASSSRGTAAATPVHWTSTVDFPDRERAEPVRRAPLGGAARRILERREAQATAARRSSTTRFARSANATAFRRSSRRIWSSSRSSSPTGAAWRVAMPASGAPAAGASRASMRFESAKAASAQRAVGNRWRCSTR